MDTSSSSISDKIELNAHARSIGAAFVSATALGLFGAVFVDVGATCDHWSDFARELSFPVQVTSVSPKGEGSWELGLRETLSADSVCLSSRVSGHLSANLQLTLPHETVKRIPLDLKLESLEMPWNEKLGLKALLDQYFTTDLSAPCPLDGLIFPVVKSSVNTGRTITIQDSTGALESLHHQIVSVSHASSTRSPPHLPLSSQPWLISGSRTEERWSNESEEEVIEDDLSAITCATSSMTSSLPTYMHFFRQSKSNASNSSNNKTHFSSSSDPSSAIDVSLWNRLSTSSDKLFPPTIAFIGAVAASEIVKIVGRVNKLLNQWFFFDVPELAPFLAEPRSGTSAGDALLFPPSQHSSLERASILLIGQGECASEVCKNLALSEICSKGSLSVISALSKHLSSDTSHPTLAASKALHLYGQTGLQKFVELRAYRGNSAFYSSPELSGIPHLDVSWQSDLAIYADPPNRDADVHCFSALHSIPAICPSSSEPSSSVECVIPHLSSERASTSASMWMHSPHSHSPSSVLSCFNWATEHIKEMIDTTEAPRSLAIAQAGQGQHSRQLDLAARWLVEPCRSLEDCVEWSMNWLHKAFVHTPKDILGFCSFEHRGTNGLHWGRHRELPPRSLLLSLEKDKTYSDCLAAIALITAIQRGLVPMVPGGLSPTLESCHSSMKPLLLEIAAKLVPLTYTEHTAVLPNAIAQALLIAAAPTFDPANWTPTIIDYQFSANPSQAEVELLVGLVNMRSRCYGLGTLPRELITKFWLDKYDISALPTSIGATSALTTIEAIKVLLNSLSGSGPSYPSASPFRNHFINLQALQFRSVIDSSPVAHTMPTGAKKTNWDLDHFYVPSSLTVQDLRDLMYTKHKVNIDLISSGVNLLWFDAAAHIRSRLYAPVLSVVSFVTQRPPNDPYTLEVELVGSDDNGNDMDILFTAVLHFTDVLQ